MGILITSIGKNLQFGFGKIARKVPDPNGSPQDKIRMAQKMKDFWGLYWRNYSGTYSEFFWLVIYVSC